MVLYAGAHYVFRIVGHFGASATDMKDKWSTGFKLGDVAGGDVPGAGGLQGFLEAIYPAVANFHAAPGVKAGTTCFLDELTAARVGNNGFYNPPDQNTTRRPYSAPVAGSGSGQAPWNTAMVISLRTTFPRGIASNGRVYYPAIAQTTDPNTGRLTSAAQNFVRDEARALINSINSSAGSVLGSGVRVCVMGAAGKTGPQRTALVTSIRVDNRLDSIERRENDQAPGYSSVPIP